MFDFSFCLFSLSWLFFLTCQSYVDQVMGAYGYNIEHILMVDIIPDPSVRKAMNEINAGYLSVTSELYRFLMFILLYRSLIFIL